MVTCASAHEMKLPLGYQLQNRLGRGSFGEVWDATTPDGQLVALKFLPSANHPGGASNEIRQLLVLKELRHPHLIQFHDVFATANGIIISMERADGNLADLHTAYREETGGPIPPDHLCDLFDQAAAALDFLASQRLSGSSLPSAGLQHCDVKPTNLLLFGDCLKLADFTLCTQLHIGSSRNQFWGTPPYAAPELYQGRLNNRIDQYALAVSYCQLRAGRFCGRTPDLDLVESTPDERISELSQVPERERAVLTRSLNADPYLRWPSCLELMKSLRQAIAPPLHGRSPAKRDGAILSKG